MRSGRLKFCRQFQGIFVDQNTSYAPPTAGTILKFISRRAWRSKWLIGAAALAAAVLAFALHHPVEIWTGRMRITIGEAPPLSFIFQSSGPSLAPLEPSRALVARLSDKYFREKIGNSVSFAPETAAVSKTAVISSLRGIVLEDEKEIMVEVSAGSPGDVQAALEAVATQIGNIHRELMDRSLRPPEGPDRRRARANRDHGEIQRRIEQDAPQRER